RSAYDSAGAKISVQILRVVSEFVFEQIDIGMLDMPRRIVAFFAGSYVFVMRRIGVRWHIRPIGEFAVDGDLVRRLGLENPGKHQTATQSEGTSCARHPIDHGPTSQPER